MNYKYLSQFKRYQIPNHMKVQHNITQFARLLGRDRSMIRRRSFALLSCGNVVPVSYRNICLSSLFRASVNFSRRGKVGRQASRRLRHFTAVTQMHRSRTMSSRFSGDPESKSGIATCQALRFPPCHEQSNNGYFKNAKHSSYETRHYL